MPDRTSADVHRLVSDLRDRYKSERQDDYDLPRQLISGTRDYTNQIAEILRCDPAEVQNKHHGRFWVVAQAVISFLQVARTVQASQSSDTDTAGRENDEFEAAAGSMLHNLDPRLEEDADAITDAALGPAGYKILGIREFKNPKRDRKEYPDTDEGNKGYLAEVEEYKKSHQRLTVRSVDPMAIGEMEDKGAGGEGSFSVIVIDEEVPILSLSGKGRDADEAEIDKALTDKFGDDVRVATGIAQGSDSGESWWDQSVRRLIIRDRYEEQVWIGQKGSSNTSGWREDKTHRRKNTFGSVGVVRLPGFVIPHAPVRIRHMGVLLGLARLYDALNFTVNLALTLGIRDRAYNQLAAEEINAISNAADDKLKLMMGMGVADGLVPTFGKVTSAGEFANHLLSDVVPYLKEEIRECEQFILSFIVQPETPDNATVSLVLAKRNDGQSFHKRALTGVVNADAEIIKCWAHDVVYSESQYYTDDKMSYRLTGAESAWFSTKKSLGEHSVSKDYFKKVCDGRATVTVSPVTDDESTKALRKQEVRADMSLGLATMKDALAAGGEQDVTGRELEIVTYNNLQIEAPRVQAAFRHGASRYYAWFWGAETEEEVAYHIQVIEAAGGGMQPPPQQGSTEGSGGMMVKPPPSGQPVAAG